MASWVFLDCVRGETPGPAADGASAGLHQGSGEATAQPRQLPDPPSTATPPGPRGGDAQLRLLRAMRPDVLERLASGGKPDGSGAVGHNRPEWRGAQYQRGAALYFVSGVVRGDHVAAEDAWRAIDLAFSHQAPDGSFDARNESGTPSAPKDVASDAAFWLAQLDQALLVARASPMADAFRARTDALLPKLRPSGSLLLAGREALVARESRATNRYFVDALAYALTGLLVGDASLETAGASFVDLGLKKQDPAGFFDESGGADTSYNCVSVLMLQVYGLYFPSAAIDAALARAVSWELTHVLASGEIDVAGNSRTGLGQETYFGKPKDINYGEAVLALSYYGLAHADAAAVAGGDRAFAFRFSNGGSRNGIDSK
jgi:hypothetical protein